jgi:4'-phosphopantetheinyl transferase
MASRTSLAAGHIELADRTVRVHAVHLEAPDAVAAQFLGILTVEESERAARFAFRHLQHSFILARGALRMLLGQYLGAAPNAIPLRYGSQGKPGLGESARLRFNVSHSGALAMFVFTLDCEVGIDVEEIRPVPEMEQIAMRQFSAGQTAELMSLPAGMREPAFFRCWTRMEAYVKALGRGMASGHGVAAGPGMSATRAEAGAWTLHDLDVPPPYAAALAYLDATRPLRMLPAVEAAALLA